MGRSDKDKLKRAMAQAQNHLASAVLDVNEVYERFAEAVLNIATGAVIPQDANGQPIQTEHAAQAEQLKLIMIRIAADRELILDFTKKVWELDEDSLITYL